MNATDFDVDRFRLHVRRDVAHRDEDHEQVQQARLRVRVGLDFARGQCDVYPSETVVESEIEL